MLYNIDYRKALSRLTVGIVGLGLGLLFIVILVYSYTDDDLALLNLMLFIPGIFCLIGIIDIIRAIYKYIVTKRLARCGVLVKGLPYSLTKSNTKVNGEALMYICTFYTFPNGKEKKLKSEPLSGKLLNYSDGLCDLLFDPNNYNNYFLDYEITTTGIGNPQIIYASDDEISKYGREYTSLK